ncbi:MAG: urate hydroxylase PuuD [Oceanicaulis sp.]|nr:urate hydroxylase PuuD [Oceanicaulis sp.]
MANVLTNLRTTVLISVLLALAFFFIYVLAGQGVGLGEPQVLESLLRWTHVVAGIMWIGLLWYFNFVQIPTMPSIPDEMKPAIGKHIAPAALFWFRWGAAFTVLTGVLLALAKGYLLETLTLGATVGFAPGFVFMGIGMWLALIMAFNVWFIIWPKQKIALGLVEADAEAKPKAARTAMLFSRTNTLLSLPMLVAMASFQTLG